MQTELQIRVSLEVPNTPRFILCFTKEHYPNVKSFIQFICAQTGIDEKVKYLLMLEDSVIVNMESVRDNDRLTLIPAKNLMNENGVLQTPQLPQNGLLIADQAPP